MRLSDAIAMGRMIISPRSGSGETETTGCALSMAAAAVGLKKDGNRSRWQRSSEEWAWLVGCCQSLPCGCAANEAWQDDKCYFWAIIHVFDTHVEFHRDWTLDQLIDWVRSVEPAESEEGEQISTQESVPCTTGMSFRFAPTTRKSFGKSG